MRSEEEIFSMIRRFADADERIRAVLLNGSRADVKRTKDIFQDFDVVFIVSEISSFLRDHDWINVFGERLILQMPDEMVIGQPDANAFHYLMLFTDGNRIDLTLFPLEKVATHFIPELPTVLLLDKDGLFRDLSPFAATDHPADPPSQKEFTDCCNEFWWVSTYVAKGLWRDEIVYAKAMLEGPVRSMFMKILEWHIGIENDFSVSFGKSGRDLKKLVSPELYDRILLTYADSNTNNTWNALFIMLDIFSLIARGIAVDMNFFYNTNEEQNVMAYLVQVHENRS